MITVQGNLKDPLGKGLVGACIRFTAVAAEGDLFKGISGEALTGSGGAYNFTLHKGRYRLEVLLTDEYHESGIVLVDDNTPTEITLVQLWAYTAPLNPPLLNPAKPVWDELYQSVLAGDEWAREAEEQVRDTNVLVNADKSIHKSGEAYLAKETLTSSIGSVNQSTQVLTYKDEYAQEASASTTEVYTRNATGSESIGSYTHSDGSTEVQKRVELTGTTGSTTKVMTEGKDTYAKVVGVQSTHSEESAGSTTAVYKHGNNQVSTNTAVQYIDADKFVQALIEQNVRLTYSNNGFPVEAFNRLLVNPHGSTNTIQADKHIIQAVDGFPVATFDTANREIIFDSKLTFKNTDDFIGEEGWSYDWDFEYSNDQATWKPEYTFGDIWRKGRKFKFKEADPKGTKQYVGEAIIVQLNARDGVDGDNYYLEYEYTTAQSYPLGWRSNFASGDDWRRWRSVRITPTGTEISKWQAEPMKGTDGPEGWIPEYQIFYGPDATKPLYTDQDNDGSLDDINLAHWHQNMSEGDLYKFERRVWWKSQADFTASRINLTKVPHVMEPWNGPNKIMPVAGEDYGDRFASLYLYKRAATKPSDAIGVWRYNFDSLTLEPVNGNYLGWSTSVVDGLEHLWVATGTAHSLTSVDNNIDNWDVDKLTSNGLKTATAYLYKLSDGATNSVPLPTNALTYNFLTGLIEGTPTNGWLTTPPNNTAAQGKLWRTFAPVTAEAFTTKEPVAANDWETATVLAQSGSNGSNGVHGFSNALVYLYKRSSSAGNLPSTTSTYTFSTKTLTGFNNGWSSTIPAGSGTIWVTVATASSIGDTDTIAANEWAGAVQFSENGVSITGVVNYYAKSSSATTSPTSWATAVPTLDVTNKYLWNYEKVTSSDGTSVSTPPAVIGTLSVDGVGISSVTEYYLVSSSSTGITTSTAGWTTTPQLTTTTNKYLWNYEKVTYSNGNVVNSTPVIIGTHGETGPQGVAGTNGTNGVTTYTWIRYADTSTGEGISNDPTGKSYIGFAYNKTTPTESSTPSDYMWSLIKGDKGNTGATGAPGANGTTTYTWIKYSNSADGTGLYDTPTTSTNYIGIATNKTTATESTNKADYTWSLFKGANGANGVDGVDGINAAMLMVFQRTTGTPSKPSANVVYTFTSGALSGLNNGWNTTIPSGTAPVWVTTASALSQAATDTITPSEWATPVIMAQSGMDGKHGAGSYVITVTNATYIPNDAGKDNHILQLSSRGAIVGDIITYTDAGRTFSKSYLRGASIWTEFKYTFDGSVIVDGTLAAETLKAGTSITDKLYISSTKNPAEMTLSGTSDWRLWLGNAVATSAPFRVDKWGNLTAANANLTNANVAGKVTATSGSFTGTVNASSGSFTGTVNANAGTFNNITIAENCNVLGTVYAKRIVGDVTKVRAFDLGLLAGQIIPGGTAITLLSVNFDSADFNQELTIEEIAVRVWAYEQGSTTARMYVKVGSAAGVQIDVRSSSGDIFLAIAPLTVAIPAGQSSLTIYYVAERKTSYMRYAKRRLIYLNKQGGTFSAS